MVALARNGIDGDGRAAGRLALLHSAQRDLARAVEVRTNELSEANRQLQMREAQLQYAAHHDPLTGLGNRRHLMEFAESALDDARRHGNSMALLLIDLDHFKPINDTHGHDAGDVILRALGELLRQRVRIYDLACRFGGEEMSLIMPGCSIDDAQLKLEIIRAEVEAGNKDAASTALAAASRKLDKAVSKGVIHKNQAANKKSAMAKQLNNL